MFELRVAWRYLYSGPCDRRLLLAAAVAGLVAIAGALVHAAAVVVLGMAAAATCTLLAMFTVFTSVSVLGVALGVASLVVVLAITTGFQRTFEAKVLGVNAHVIVMRDDSFREYRDVMAKAKAVDPGVLAVQPFDMLQLLVTRGKGQLSGVALKGVDPALVHGVLDLDSHMIAGSIDALAQRGREPPIIIGAPLATKLAATLGDEITVVLPASSPPRSKQFRIVGLFAAGFDEYDRRLMYASLRDTQELLGGGDRVNGVELKLADISRASVIARELAAVLGGSPYQVVDWYELNENLFSALKLQKLALVIILTLIIIVATVNMVSALTLMVTDKTREIAIMKSMGSTSRVVRRIFIVLGLAIGGVGTLAGVAIGLVTCAVMQRYGYQLDPKVYLIDRLPITIVPHEVLLVVGITLAISLIATVFPSRDAASLTPVEGLRYD